MLNIHLNGKQVFALNSNTTLSGIHSYIHNFLNTNIVEYYLLQNGKIINEDTAIKQGIIHIVLRTCGGKGGFGSMLRAIGAQIEKTTNREACRDLSGRRLRDINEEKRLKKWITLQSEREKEAADRRQKKLEKLCEEPKHEFKDKNYDNERSQLPEIVENAVSQGLKATCSDVSLKRKINDDRQCKKKRKLWIDDDLDDLSSNGSDESDDESNSNTASSDTSVGKSKHITLENIEGCNHDGKSNFKENNQVHEEENSKEIFQVST